MSPTTGGSWTEFFEPNFFDTPGGGLATETASQASGWPVAELLQPTQGSLLDESRHRFTPTSNNSRNTQRFSPVNTNGTALDQCQDQAASAPEPEPKTAVFRGHREWFETHRREPQDGGIEVNKEAHLSLRQPRIISKNARGRVVSFTPSSPLSPTCSLPSPDASSTSHSSSPEQVCRRVRWRERPKKSRHGDTAWVPLLIEQDQELGLSAVPNILHKLCDNVTRFLFPSHYPYDREHSISPTNALDCNYVALHTPRTDVCCHLGGSVLPSPHWSLKTLPSYTLQPVYSATFPRRPAWCSYRGVPPAYPGPPALMPPYSERYSGFQWDPTGTTAAPHRGPYLTPSYSMRGPRPPVSDVVWVPPHTESLLPQVSATTAVPHPLSHGRRAPVTTAMRHYASSRGSFPCALRPTKCGVSPAPLQIHSNASRIWDKPPLYPMAPVAVSAEHAVYPSAVQRLVSSSPNAALKKPRSTPLVYENTGNWGAGQEGRIPAAAVTSLTWTPDNVKEPTSRLQAEPKKELASRESERRRLLVRQHGLGQVILDSSTRTGPYINAASAPQGSKSGQKSANDIHPFSRRRVHFERQAQTNASKHERDAVCDTWRVLNCRNTTNINTRTVELPASNDPCSFPNVASIPLSPFRRSRIRRALCIGVATQKKSSCTLDGPVNDAQTMRAILMGDPFRYTTRLLVDTGSALSAHRLPTKANILEGIQWLAEGTTSGDSALLYFAGCSFRTQCSGDKRKWCDALVPCDCEYTTLETEKPAFLGSAQDKGLNNCISGNELRDFLRSFIPHEVQFIAVLDTSCTCGLLPNTDIVVTRRLNDAQWTFSSEKHRTDPPLSRPVTPLWLRCSPARLKFRTLALGTSTSGTSPAYAWDTLRPYATGAREREDTLDTSRAGGFYSLCACADTEEAAELCIEGCLQGLFTYCVARALKSYAASGDEMTVAGLYNASCDVLQRFLVESRSDAHDIRQSFILRFSRSAPSPYTAVLLTGANPHAKQLPEQFPNEPTTTIPRQERLPTLQTEPANPSSLCCQSPLNTPLSRQTSLESPSPTQHPNPGNRHRRIVTVTLIGATRFRGRNKGPSENDDVPGRYHLDLQLEQDPTQRSTAVQDRFDLSVLSRRPSTNVAGIRSSDVVATQSTADDYLTDLCEFGLRRYALPVESDDRFLILSLWGRDSIKKAFIGSATTDLWDTSLENTSQEVLLRNEHGRITGTVRFSFSLEPPGHPTQRLPNTLQKLRSVH